MNSSKAAPVWRRNTLGMLLASCVIALMATATASLAASSDQAPPVPAGQVRIWFLRELNPGTAMNSPMLYANGTPITIISQGTVFFRNLAPGTYTFAVDNCRPGSQRSLTIPFAAGNEFALQVRQDDFGPLDCGPTFYLSVPRADDLSSLFAPLEYLGQR